MSAEKGKNVVLDVSFMLGDDWNAKANLIEVQDRDGKNVYGLTLSLNEQGYVTIGSDIICKLSTDQFTRISVAHDDTANTLTVYVNGVLLYTRNITDSSFVCPTKFRIVHYVQDSGHQRNGMSVPMNLSSP